MSVSLQDIIDVVEAAYPPRLAQEWDSVGLVCGDPQDPVGSVTVAVDATAAVLAQVPARGLLLVHHPLLLRGVDTVAASTPKGALVHELIRTGRSLFTAHTNADRARPGVSDALAEAIGVEVDGVLAPVADRSVAPSAEVGLGRVGRLAAPEPLPAFVSRVARGLPTTSWGVRAAGDENRAVSRVAVCGGAGDSLLGEVAESDVDVYVTADLRHHPADEHRRASGVALVDVAHWASEFPWCAQAADVLRGRFGSSLRVQVCTVRTDPWNIEDVNP